MIQTVAEEAPLSVLMHVDIFQVPLHYLSYLFFGWMLTRSLNLMNESLVKINASINPLLTIGELINLKYLFIQPTTSWITVYISKRKDVFSEE